MGILLAALYAVVTAVRNRSKPRENRKGPNLGVAFGLFLATCGGAAGVKLCFLSMFTNTLASVLSFDERIYVVGGGFAVIWTSVGVIYRTFFEPE